MRQGLRRTIGLGGAAFVAVGAALVLTLPASANEMGASVSCATDNSTTVIIDIHTVLPYITDAKHPHDNQVSITDASGKTTLFSDTFGATYSNQVASTKLTPPFDGTTAHTIVVHAVAFDGKTGKDDIKLTTPICPENQPSKTTAPPTTTTTAPPSHSSSQPPAPTTTTTAVVAAASSQLPNTGVNAGMPLMIAGFLVVAGGGILLWLRIAAKRRGTNNS